MSAAAATPVALPPAAPARAARSPWFHSPAFDLLLILGVPFVTWPLVMLAQDAWGAELLTKLILLTASGHYAATFVRAYGDRELLQRFPLRFVLVPPLLLATCVLLLANGNGPALLLVTAAWGFWHWLAQAFGFARIYDSKVGSFRPLTARLDKALVITGFVAAVVLNDQATATFAKVALDAGVPLPSAAQFAVVQTVVLAACVAVGAAYLGNLAWTIARGLPWSWQKQVMHVTTIGYYWFAFAWLPNVLVAYVLYELFHDVQYYAITWLACRQRVRRPGAAAWLSWLFRPGLVATLVFVVATLAYGAADLFGRDLAPSLLGVFLCAALLHYYFDGFVWKARESAIAADLGIQGGLRAAVVPGLRHGARWGLFAVPLVLLLAFAGEPVAPRERFEALVAVAPGDFLSRAELAFEQTRARELPAALANYRAAVAANPGFAQARVNFGAALELAGDPDAAREQYEAALQCRDHGGAHAHAHVNLGIVLLLRGDRNGARQHFEAGRVLGGEHPIGRMLGLAPALPAGADARRRQLYEGVLELDANQPDARFELGRMQLADGRYEAAARHFEALLQRRPDHVEGLVGRATALAALGRADEARALLHRALDRDPQNAVALALQSRLAVR